MKKLLKILGLSLFASLIVLVNKTWASEVLGNLSTGISSTVGNTVNGIVIAAPSASIPAGSYASAQSVVLSSLGSDSIRYTTDNTALDCSNGTLYTGQITISAPLTLKAISCYLPNRFSSVATYQYTIAIPVVSSGGGGGGGGGTYTAPVAVIAPTPILAPVIAPIVQPVAAQNPVEIIVPKVLGERVVNVTEEEKGLMGKVDQNLVKRLAGRILLQVQNYGQAWYLDPVSLKKYYLANGNDAYTALRKFGLGITNANLAKIPIGTGTPVKSTGSTAFVNRLKGRILIQVESKGEAWYVNPVDGKRYYMSNGDAAYKIMRNQSLGIINTDIRKIPVGELAI